MPTPSRGAATALGGDALALHADVRDEDAVRDAVEQAAARWDGLDVVVANAAIQLVGSDDRADRLDRAVWQETLDVNLTGAFLTAKHGARALLADRRRRDRVRRVARRELRDSARPAGLRGQQGRDGRAGADDGRRLRR